MHPCVTISNFMCIFKILKKNNKNRHYLISYSKSYLIKEVAKLFSKNIKYIQKRKGERFESAIIKSIRGKKIINLPCKIALEDYVNNFKKKLIIIVGSQKGLCGSFNKTLFNYFIKRVDFYSTLFFYVLY
mgnify:CR=1 FL=1